MFTPLDVYLHLPRAPHRWVVEHLIPVGGLVNVFGKPKTGKSFFALGLAQAIINGDTDWQGYPIQQHGPVAYLQIDTPREEWHTRLAKLSFPPQPDGRTLWMADMWQVPEFPFNILNPQRTELRWLKDALAEIQPVLTIIDTLREAHGGDENDSTTMRNVLAELVGACRPSAILFLSHARKDSLASTGEEDLMDQGRGSSYVAGRMDVVIKITPKRLIFKGRATGQTTEVIKQDLHTGLILIEPGPNDKATYAEIRSVLADLTGPDPAVSQRALAAELAKRTHTSHSTALRRLTAYYKDFKETPK